MAVSEFVWTNESLLTAAATIFKYLGSNVPEHQEQIFRLFNRLHGDKYTGIGLAIVRKGVERMGGGMGLESAPGQGSRFRFELKKGW